MFKYKLAQLAKSFPNFSDKSKLRTWKLLFGTLAPCVVQATVHLIGRAAKRQQNGREPCWASTSREERMSVVWSLFSFLPPGKQQDNNCLLIRTSNLSRLKFPGNKWTSLCTELGGILVCISSIFFYYIMFEVYKICKCNRIKKQHGSRHQACHANSGQMFRENALLRVWTWNNSCFTIGSTNLPLQTLAIHLSAHGSNHGRLTGDCWS